MYIYSKRAKNRFLPFYPSVILGESFGYPLVRSANRVLNEYRKNTVRVRTDSKPATERMRGCRKPVMDGVIFV